MSALSGLIEIANSLDKKGEYQLADELDKAIVILAGGQSWVTSRAGRNNLVSTIRDENKTTEDVQKAFLVFVHSVGKGVRPDDELNMSLGEYKAFANAIMSGDIDKARDISGMQVKKYDPENIDTNVYNPFTGRPWASGPIEERKDGCSDLEQILKAFRDKFNPIEISYGPTQIEPDGTLSFGVTGEVDRIAQTEDVLEKMGFRWLQAEHYRKDLECGGHINLKIWSPAPIWNPSVFALYIGWDDLPGLDLEKITRGILK